MADSWSLGFELSDMAERNFKCELEKLMRGSKTYFEAHMKQMIEWTSFSSAKAHYSQGTLLPRHTTPKAHYSQGTLLPRHTTPKAHYSR